jgi:hypothetical protein
MVVVAMNMNDLYIGTPLPPQLADFIQPHIWQQLCDSVRDCHREANCMACVAEWTICILFMFPCIFLCHPCCADLFTDLQKKMRHLNAIHYQGRHVFQAHGRSEILIDTSLIPGFVAQAYTPPIQVYSASENAYTVYETPQMATAVNAPTNTDVIALEVKDQDFNITHSPQHALNTMQVTIPLNCPAGTELNVQAPSGDTIKVTIPEGLSPGQTITVNY